MHRLIFSGSWCDSHLNHIGEVWVLNMTTGASLSLVPSGTKGLKPLHTLGVDVREGV